MSGPLTVPKLKKKKFIQNLMHKNDFYIKLYIMADL
jgi:hypothetical protein